MYLFSVVVALVISLANSIGFFAGVWGTKPGEVYLGTTHYFEDYFLYLNQFFQGASGRWLTLNRYTSEPTQPSILFWPNVLLGKLGGLMGFPPEISYNLSVILLSFAVLIALSSLMQQVFPKDKTKALVAFLLAATATSFMNHIWVDGRPMWYPFQLWKTPNFALDRLGGVPHQIVQTLLFLLLVNVWFFGSKKLLRGLILIIMLTTLNPVMSALFLVAAWAATPSRKLILPSIGFLLTAWYYNTLSNGEPHIQSKLWEASQQIATTPLFMLLSIGPVSLVGIAGAWVAVKHARPIYIFSVTLLVTGYLLYFSPIPNTAGISNSRVLFPAMYAAWGILGVLGLVALAKTRVLFVLVSSLILILSIPTLTWELGQKLLVKPEERTPLLYLPESVSQAFAYLKNQRSFDDIVLSSPASHMDALVPALTGHTGYTGHPFATIGSDRKQAEASRFFQKQMRAEEAREWLGERRIRFILFTMFDGDAARFREAYPFLTVQFQTEGATIWSW